MGATARTNPSDQLEPLALHPDRHRPAWAKARREGAAVGLRQRPSHSGKEAPPRGHVLAALGQGEHAPGEAAETDVVLHLGDLAYATGYESEWDRFMSQVCTLRPAPHRPRWHGLRECG